MAPSAPTFNDLKKSARRGTWRPLKAVSTSPANAADFASIKAPVLGLYGADDARVNATIEPASAEM